MQTDKARSFTAFADSQKIACGSLWEISREIKKHLEIDTRSTLLIFDDVNGQEVDVDFSYIRPPNEEADRKVGPGRPKLGVIAREITLLPEHWDWLSLQPGGASVTLRKLVEAARKTNVAQDQIRQARDAAYRFMTTMAGNLPGYEEALRALYAGDADGMAQQILNWPPDVRTYLKQLATAAF